MRPVSVLAVAAGCAAVLGATAATPARAASHCPMISARLGLHWPYSSLPENSVAAIHAARRAGAPKVEVDVRFSRDGVPMAVHDLRLDRVTAHSGQVNDYAAATLRTFRLKVKGVRGSSLMSDHHMATLYEVLHQARADGMRISVEIKPRRLTAAQARAVARPFGRLNLWRKIDVRSFHPPVLAAMRAADPRIRTTLTVHSPVIPARIRNVMESINFHRHGVTIRSGTVRALHAVGLQVDAWTPNTSSEFAKVPLTVDQITTNNVKGALAFLKARGC